jgi:hypothetical protein
MRATGATPAIQKNVQLKNGSLADRSAMVPTQLPEVFTVEFPPGRPVGV